MVTFWATLLMLGIKDFLLVRISWKLSF